MRLIAGVALLCACGSSSYAVQGPDGTEHQAVSCRRSIANCWEEAAALCPGGYDIIDKDSHVRIVPTGLGPVGTQRHEVLVRCRPAMVNAWGQR